MELINCTPHTINVWDDKGETELLVLPASGILPRVSVETHVTHYIGDIPIFATQFGEVQNLPEKEDGKFLIVSRMVLDAAPNRDDLLTVGELIRRKLDDGNTVIVGCKGLSK